jgi:membrane protease YdiL (CAAX protease family)
MTDSAGIPEQAAPLFVEAPLLVEPVKKGQPMLAWLVIILLVSLIVMEANFRPSAEGGEEEDKLPLTLMQVQARFLVGIGEFAKDKQKEIVEQVKSLDQGSVGQRLRYAVLIGELEGPQKALDQLTQLDEKVAEKNKALTPDESRTRKILGRLYEDYADGNWAGPAVDAGDREFLKNQFEWFGELALAPSHGSNKAEREEVMSLAFRTMVAFLGAIVFFGLVALAGLVGLIIFLVMMLAGSLEHLKSFSNHGGVYAETFAVWLVLFIGLRIVAGRLFGADEKLLMSGAVSLMSLLALSWPVLRGIPWKQVREDIGLTWGRNPSLEPVIGLGAYVISIPLAGIGLVITLFLIQLVAEVEHAGQGNEFSPSSYPTHPIVQILASGDWWVKFEALLLASVVAPIVEEIMFRGVLYRHLREGTRRLGWVASAFVSAVGVSFIFAAIHPQGLLTVPALMGLAFGFTLIREWRSTLIPSMIAHGINNGLVLLVTILAFGN